MDKRVAEVVLRKCLGHRTGESVLIVADTVMERTGSEFHRAAAAAGIEAALLVAPPAAPGAEPPPVVAEALKNFAAAVLLTSTSLSHTRARREASERHRVRIASMPGVDPARLGHLLAIDYDGLVERGEELARRFEGPHTVRVTSAAGTDLRFAVGNRPVVRDVGNLREPGAFGDLPCGEVCLAPLEGTAEGTLVVDGSVARLGLVTEPVRIRFEKGRAAEISDKRLAELLAPHGELALNLAEFGIGLNPHAEIVGNIIEDEKAHGTVHLALGDNVSMGGVVSVPVHVDAVLLDARVAVDGTALPEGWFKTARPSAVGPPAPAFDVREAETFQALFRHSNDAQYVLDLETQKFLEVNPSFERISGYTREELLSGAVTAPDLVARESRTTFEQKRETRKLNPSERYDLRVMTKGGEKKPIELSVKRMVLQGREVVLGSARDLSAHKRLEQDMWEKIQELGFASNRILALTEKIRKVPEFTPKLLSITDEHTLLERAAEILCSRDGLAYEQVTFYLQKGDELELWFATTNQTRKLRQKVTSDSRLVRILRGEDPGGISRTSAVLPLKGRDRNIGVIEVSFHPKEIEVLEGNEQALKGYQDLLETMSSIIGLLVDNLHLYETIRLQSIVDPLTGTYNRRYFDQRLGDEFGRAARYGRALSLMLIDLDRLKEINDTFGHKQGDLVIVETAKLFKTHSREVDGVCRIGGDEFAIVMPETSYEGALAKAEQLRREVAEKRYDNLADPAQPLRVSLSVGVTSYAPDAKTADELVKVADEALYAAKRSGRDTACGALPRAPRDPGRPATKKSPASK